MATRKCDSRFKADLKRINAEMAFEDELALASEQMEAYELFDQADQCGDIYSKGYREGFWAGRGLQRKLDVARTDSLNQKHEWLRKKWGL